MMKNEQTVKHIDMVRLQNLCIIDICYSLINV